MKPTGSPSVASKQKEAKPSLDKADGSNLDVEIIEVPDVDLSLEEWSMCAHKLKPGQNIDILVTVRNLSSRAITESLSLRVDRDAFFQSVAVRLPSSVPANGEVKVKATLRVQGGITNLNKLPANKEIMLVKECGPGKLAKLSSMFIVIPIDPFIRYLKEEFRPIRLQLWGLFGTGKSSFINSMATLYNEDPRFPNRKLTPAFSRPSGVSVTTELKQYDFNNVSLCDSWGWEEARKDLYSDLLFQLMLGGRLGREFAMDNAKTLSVLKLPNVETAPVDLVLFFITVGAVENNTYLEQMNHFIGEARKLGVPLLVLLTQIDKVDPSLRQDPYSDNPTVQDLVTQVSLKAELDESFILPVVNYTRETERTWAMDRAAFVTLYRAFQAREVAVGNA